MSRLSQASKLLLLAVLTLATTALLANAPATAQSQPCLTVLDSCQVCVLRTGQIDIRACGAGEPVGDRLPADLLQKPDVSDLQGLHAVVAKRILDRWEDVVHPVLVPDNGSRIYVPRELYRLALEWSSSEGTGDEWRRFAEMSWARDLIEQASGVRVDAVPSGDGGTKYVIKSTDVLVSYVLRLLDDAGAFSGVDLSKFSPGQLAAAVEGVVDSRLFEELMKTWSRLEAAGTDRQELLFRVFERLRGAPEIPINSWQGPGFVVTEERPAQSLDFDTGPGSAWRLSFEWTPGPHQDRRGKFTNLFWLVQFDPDRGSGLNRQMFGYGLFAGRCDLLMRGGMGVDQEHKSKDRARLCMEPGVTYNVMYQVDLETGEALLRVGDVEISGVIAGERGPTDGPILLARGFPDGEGKELPHIGTEFGPFVLERLR